MQTPRHRRDWKSAGAWLLLGFTAAVVLAPHRLTGVPERQAQSFMPPSLYHSSTAGNEYLLGTDYLGRSFLAVLGVAVSATAQVALGGTAAVLLGVLVVGTIHGSTQSRLLRSALSMGNLGVMAVPEAAVLITIAAIWPRTATTWHVNASMISVLVFFAIPPGARLIAERIRAVNKSGYVTASRECGATSLYTFWYDVWPHLTEDVAWIAASVLPRFVAAEVGLAYLGVEYREFEGLGRIIAKSFNNLIDSTARFQMLVTIAAILWVALIPQVVLHLRSMRAWKAESI
ncbi:MAG: hypothetical protein KDA88_14670 [Planctomycetaceae bacterium]|nr:hypothetical protein [Planctomycetaceae bacterium]MCB9953615.1 hypothetical protein [Planctomycetaceae bacterium]